MKDETIDRLQSENASKILELEETTKNLTKRLEELQYGAEARKGDYAKNMLKFGREKNRRGEVFTMLLNYWFEARATEEEKRQTLKRIKQGTERGEKFDPTWFDGIQKAWLA